MKLASISVYQAAVIYRTMQLIIIMLKIRQPHIILGQVNKYAPKEQLIYVLYKLQHGWMYYITLRNTVFICILAIILKHFRD